MKSRFGTVIFILSYLLSSANLWADDYKVAVRAHHGVEKARIMWQSTVDFLNQQLSPDNFTLVPVISLDEISQRAGEGEFDFVLTNPSSFVEIAQLYGATALVTLNNKRANTAQSRFGSVIFTHAKNTDILSIEDLAGKTLMAVSKPAFGGWRVAWLEMLSLGFDPIKKLDRLVFAKSKTQPEVVNAVLEGRVDVGVVRTDLLERLEAEGKIDMRYLRIIHNKNVKTFPFFLSTRLYPEWAFAALNKIPSDKSKMVADILLAILPESKAAIAGKYVGWVESMKYDEVEKLMRRLEVGPYAN